MKWERVWRQTSGVFLCLLVVVSVPLRVWSLEEETLEPHRHEAMPAGSEPMDHATHNHAPQGTEEPSEHQENENKNGHQQLDGGGSSEPVHPHHHEAAYTIGSLHGDGHHRHRAPILPPAEDQAFSEFNHQIAGVFVLFAGGFALLAASGNPRFSWAQYSWPLLFFLMGIFLFIRHDPESWPWGPLPLWEAIEDPQVLQHTLFTGIVLGIGAIEWFRCRGTLSHPAWGLIFPVLAVSAAAMLFLHKHGEGPSADKIYRHHVIMAIAGILAMAAKVLGDTQLLEAKRSGYMWSALMVFIGVMLLIYSE